MTEQANTTRSGPGEGQLLRWSGWALGAALPLQVAGFLLHPAGEQIEHITSSIYGPAHAVLFASWVLVALGLPGLYARQAARAGRLGLVAVVLATASVAHHLYLTLYEAFAVPAMAEIEAVHAHLGPDGALGHGAGALGPVAPLLLLGFPLLGVATLRARVLPRLAGWLLVAAVPAFAVAIAVVSVTVGEVGPEAETWAGGMLPIALQYWVLAAGLAVAGRALAATPTTAAVPGPAPSRTPVAG